MRRIMQYAAEMGSGAMIYIQSFINTGSEIQRLIGGDTDSMVIAKPIYISSKIR
jgi:hypothetical protein